MFKNTRHALLAGIFVLLVTAGCGGSGSSNPAAGAPPPFSQTDVVVGSGASPKPGDLLTVNYTGWLYDAGKPDQKGTQFDTSVGREPFMFTLGAGQVISGWDKGFDNMKVGGKRRLIVPPDMGYGAEGTPGGPIPPNAVLVFEMQLLDIKSK